MGSRRWAKCPKGLVEFGLRIDAAVGADGLGPVPAGAARFGGTAAVTTAAGETRVFPAAYGFRFHVWVYVITRAGCTPIRVANLTDFATDGRPFPNITVTCRDDRVVALLAPDQPKAAQPALQGAA
jgi:hypothetical protein